MNKHTVISRREVPRTQTSVGIYTGKVVTENLTHGGEKGVCVRLASGFSAWGFGPNWEAAETKAVSFASALQAANK